jgi:hypothetical protein
VKYTPTSTGSSVIVTASYSGDKQNPSSVGMLSLTVTPKASKTTVSCKPTSVVAGSSTVVKCTAKVTGYSPTGVVTWSQSGDGSVSFVSTFKCSCCALKKGSCSTIVTAVRRGEVSIVATYTGDINNMGSSGKTTLTISPSGKTST